jgi:dTDP-glucose 4,6-dehydratase
VVILVTGGAGFIGSNFLIYMVKKYKDFTFINLDKLTYAGNLENLKEIENNKNYQFVKGDIAEKEHVEDIFKKYLPDVVINFAAESHVDKSILGPEEFIRTNIYGTFVLLETCRAFWKDFSDKKFIHISTDEVYGSLGDKGYFYETTSYKPNSPYSASKASADFLVRAYYKTYGFPGIITNCSNNYGPYQFPEKLIPLIIFNALNSKPLPIYGDGKNVRDWLYVLDHCKAIESVLEKGKSGEKYNIGGNNEWENIKIVKKICEILEHRKNKGKLSDFKNLSENFEKLITFVKDRPGHDRRYAICSDKIKEQLGWVPETDFETGLNYTIDWYINNIKWVENVITGEYLKYYNKNYGDKF